MANTSALIEVDHVFKTYPVADRGERLVLDALNFRLVPGEIVGVCLPDTAAHVVMLLAVSMLARPAQMAELPGSGICVCDGPP